MLIPRLNIRFTKSDQWRFWFGKEIYQPAANEWLFNHNRSAITLALKACLPVGSRVGVMAYNCHTVANAIRQAQCEPVFIDVDENMRIDSSRYKSLKLDAIIVTHLFGIRGDVDSVRKAYPKALIIEDCAHARGILPEEIKGDVATFSIGMAKLPSIGDGGILYLRNKELEVRINNEYKKLRNYSFIQEFRLFVRMVVMQWLYTTIAYSYLTKPILKRNHGAGNILIEESIQQMSNGVRRVYGHMMIRHAESIDQQIHLQQEQAERINSMLQNNEDVERLLIGENAFMAVAICKEPLRLKEFFIQKGIETETHFRYAIEWAEQLGYKRGSCPVSEEMISKALMIPTYFKYEYEYLD